MDSLLILIQLKVLNQLKKNYASRFHTPMLKFIIDPWVQITKMYILPQIGY